ncbi:MAG: hypothetical protein ACUVR9_14345, partial [Desulfosoma sp.]
MEKSPIFIHSLFHSGSTYLSHVFRRSPCGYWCYQEPLHEAVYFAKNDPTILLRGFGEEDLNLYRHPRLDKPYFQELLDVWPAWKDTLDQSAIYDAYFPAPGQDFGIGYWQALVNAAQGRPVFQECRTSGRIGAIKARLGGYHIYLWRNPWDQWWSYEVQLVRQRHQPASWSVPIHSISAAEMAKQAAWARELARRFETNRANAEARAAEAEARAVQAEASWERIRKELHHVHQANHYHWQLAEARRQQIEALLNSKSWRITQPLRALFALALYGRDTFQRQAERITASLLSGLIRFAVSSPRVKRLALAWIG